MNDYMQTIIDKEKEKLIKFLQSVALTYNIVGMPKIISIEVTSYKNYDEVLKIVFFHKITYINIAANSVLATARILSHYLYEGTENCIGFIEEVY